MRIGIIGAGRVGLGLGTAFTAAGHEVTYASRTPGRAHDGLPAGESLQPIDETAAAVDAVVVTVPGVAIEDLLASHAGALDGRLVLDTTNYGGRYAAGGVGPLHQVPAFLAAAPRIRLYRAFCTLGYEHFVDPRRTGEQADLHFCGPDGDDRATVETLVASLGLRPVWIGGLDTADALDGATRLWFALAARPDVGRDVTFRTLGLDTTSGGDEEPTA